jgi:hypothetical protein
MANFRPHPTAVFQVVDPPPEAAVQAAVQATDREAELAARHSGVHASLRAAAIRSIELQEAARRHDAVSQRWGARSREQVCTVDGVWIDASEHERQGRAVWGAGRLADMREEASKNPLLIHVLDNAARLLGVSVRWSGGAAFESG